MMHQVLVLALLFAAAVEGLLSGDARPRGLSLQALGDKDAEQTARDLTNHGLWVTFDGFGVVGHQFSMELKSKFSVNYGRGLTANSPGFWRVLRYDDGREEVECTHPVPAEYMFFFDLEDKTLLWRGDLDMEKGCVTNGVAIANKKRFGLLPYTETVATWTAEVFLPGEALPNVAVPQLKDQKFDPPDDFRSPLDMDRYPQYFSQKYKKYFFAVEEALSKGQEPPQRPQPVFVPELQMEKSKLSPINEDDLDDIAPSRRELSAKRPVEKSKQGGKGF